MSTVPPESVPPVNPLPWEARATRGLLPAFFDTITLMVTRPAEAWTRMRESGDGTSPFFFGMAVCWLATLLQTIVFRLIAAPMMPQFLERRFGMPDRFGFGAAAIVGRLIIAPVFIGIAILIGSAILHLCCMLVGALQNSRAGFEGSLRVVGYSEVSSLASVIPFVGGLIAVVWFIILAIKGVEQIHKTTSGKATAAVLIPVVVCCGFLILIALVAGAAIFAWFAHHRS